MLPPAIAFSKATPLAAHLAAAQTYEQQTQELLGMWQSLAEVLAAFHQCGWFVRNISRDNIVHVRRGTNVGWTFLEFGNAANRKSRVSKSSMPVRSIPPEVRCDAPTVSSSPPAPCC
jgi:hypothetical protein